MKIAFDCQGVLVADGPTPEILETRTKGVWMPELVRTLVAGGAQVYCISAVPAPGGLESNGHPTGYSALVKLLRGIPLHGIYPAFVDPGISAFEVGIAKAAVMHEIGCQVIFDDNSGVCDGVRSCGKIAICYSTNWEKCQ